MKVNDLVMFKVIFGYQNLNVYRVFFVGECLTCPDLIGCHLENVSDRFDKKFWINPKKLLLVEQ